MGKVYSHIAFRISRNLNVENRAQKLISDETIRPAPKYKANEDLLERLRKENPEVSEKVERKDDDLLKRLENVYVKSKDPIEGAPEERRANLPVDRTPPTLPTFGYPEPERVPYGRATLRTAIGFLAAHAEKPAENTAEKIAHRHKLDVQVTEDILKHFKMMQMHMPSHDTGQIRQLDWTSQDPLTELAFKDKDGSLAVPRQLQESPKLLKDAPKPPSTQKPA